MKAYIKLLSFFALMSLSALALETTHVPPIKQPDKPSTEKPPEPRKPAVPALITPAEREFNIAVEKAKGEREAKMAPIEAEFVAKYAAAKDKFIKALAIDMGNATAKGDLDLAVQIRSRIEHEKQEIKADMYVGTFKTKVGGPFVIDFRDGQYTCYETSTGNRSNDSIRIDNVIYFSWTEAKNVLTFEFQPTSVKVVCWFNKSEDDFATAMRKLNSPQWLSMVTDRR